jgi:hypothetical protein
MPKFYTVHIKTVEQLVLGQFHLGDELTPPHREEFPGATTIGYLSTGQTPVGSPGRHYMTNDQCDVYD